MLDLKFCVLLHDVSLMEIYPWHCSMGLTIK